MNRYSFTVVRGTGYVEKLTMNGDTLDEANRRMFERYPDIREVVRASQIG